MLSKWTLCSSQISCTKFLLWSVYFCNVRFKMHEFASSSSVFTLEYYSAKFFRKSHLRFCLFLGFKWIMFNRLFHNIIINASWIHIIFYRIWISHSVHSMSIALYSWIFHNQHLFDLESYRCLDYHSTLHKECFV
jgi:hypothetical protein